MQSGVKCFHLNCLSCTQHVYIRCWLEYAQCTSLPIWTTKLTINLLLALAKRQIHWCNLLDRCGKTPEEKITMIVCWTVVPFSDPW